MGRLSRLLLLLAVLTLAVPAAVRAQSDTVVRGGSAIYPSLEVNIDDNGRLARLHMAFEVQCTDEQGAQMAASPQAREAIILYFRDKHAADLVTPKDKRRLKNELVAAINKAIGGPRAVNILFMQFVIL